MTNSKFIPLTLSLFFFLACDTTAPPETTPEAGEMSNGGSEGGRMDESGTEAGEMTEAGTEAGEMTEAGTEAGTMNGAGTEAGEMGAGFEIISAGDEAGEMSETPTIDPTAPLPEPMATSVEPPTAIAEAGEDEVDASCTGTYVNEARGWVVNEVGEPLGGARVQMCSRHAETGILACSSPSDTNSEGYFSIKVSMSARCMASYFTIIGTEVAFAPMYWRRP